MQFLHVNIQTKYLHRMLTISTKLLGCFNGHPEHKHFIIHPLWILQGYGMNLSSDICDIISVRKFKQEPNGHCGSLLLSSINNLKNYLINSQQYIPTLSLTNNILSLDIIQLR